MTDRFNGLIVTLENDIRSDDAEATIAAISCLRGVLSVKGNVADLNSHFAEQRARHEIGDKLWHVLYGEKNPP